MLDDTDNQYQTFYSSMDKDKGKEKKENAEKTDGFLKEIMAISGQPGLFRFIAQARNGIIVESLDTGKRMHAFSSVKISALEEISVYTEEKEASLAEVLKLIHDKEGGGEAISHKSDNEKLKEYFSEVMPAYDKDRVYVSDIRKILNWYNILRSHELLDFDEKQEDKKEDEDREKEAGEADQEKTGPQSQSKTGKDKQKPARKPESRSGGKVQSRTMAKSRPPRKQKQK